MELLDVCKNLIEATDAFKAVPGAVCLVEDRLNPAALAQRYAAHRMRVLVAAVAHERRANVGEQTFGAWTLQVTVFENATRRSENDDAPSLLDVAAAAVSALHWQTVAGARVVYQDMTRIDESGEELRMVVTFRAWTGLAQGAVVWGAGDALLSGDVFDVSYERGGVNVFEPSRKGDAKYVGTRDRHWKISVSALAAVSDPDALPDFGETFSYGGRSYVTESASLKLEGENVATIRLTGRTVPAAI